MGTNFYARIIPTKERKEELKKLIDEDKFHEIVDEVSLTYSAPNQYEWRGGIIHLGKRSGGWKFLWNPNVWKVPNGTYDPETKKYVSSWEIKQYYDLTKKGILEFLMRPDVKLYDEYDEEYTDKEAWFKEIVERDFLLWQDKEPMLDGEAYYKKYPRERMYSDYERDNFWRSLGYQPTGYYDFYSDGLRFSTSVEFS